MDSCYRLSASWRIWLNKAEKNIAHAELESTRRIMCTISYMIEAKAARWNIKYPLYLLHEVQLATWFSFCVSDCHTSVVGGSGSVKCQIKIVVNYLCNAGLTEQCLNYMRHPEIETIWRITCAMSNMSEPGSLKSALRRNGCNMKNIVPRFITWMHYAVLSKSPALFLNVCSALLPKLGVKGVVACWQRPWNRARSGNSVNQSGATLSCKRIG